MKIVIDKSFLEHKVDEREKKQMLWLSAIMFTGATIAIILGIAGENGELPTLFRVTLLTLSFMATFGSLIVGAFLILRSYSSGDKEARKVTEEVEALANDASFDVSEQIIFWDKLKYTKGVGTQLEGQEEEIDTICRRLENVRKEISAAETPRHCLEAVLAADSLLATVRSLR